MTQERAELIARMDRLAEQGIDCSACAGTCCTFVANSMQIAAAEAELIADHLHGAPEGVDEWIQKLTRTISVHGLDRPLPGDGRRTFGRRRYSCSFFRGAGVGCALPREIKPLGCLAFNPRRGQQKEGGDCATPGLAIADAGETLPIPLAVLKLLRATRDLGPPSCYRPTTAGFDE